MIAVRRRAAGAVALLLGILLLPRLVGAVGQCDAGAPAPEQQVDELFSVIAGKDAPGAAVAVVRAGRVVLSKGYGFANLEDRVPNTPQAKFRLASVTKSFTALAILQLSEAGRVELDAPIVRYLADTPNGDRITVRHLLTHTSGIRDREDDPLQSSPGARVEYSNAGYRLLGRIVEAVSGESWEQYLASHIFGPLGMKNTGCDHLEEILPHRARGYVFDGKGGYLNAAPEDIAQTAWAAGALYSTVEDLCLWAQALDSGRLLRPATIGQASTPCTLNDGTQAGVGLGWLVSGYRGLREVSHGGDASGHNAWVGRYPDQGLTVIVLSNVCTRPAGPLPSAMSLGRAIAAIYLGALMQPETGPAEFPLTPEMMQAFVGRYRLEGRREIIEAGGGILTLEIQNGRLIAYDAAGRIELRGESPDAFHASGDSNTTFRFERDAQGRVTGLAARLMGIAEIRGVKLPE